MPATMPIPGVEFTVNDRGGQYFGKLQALAAAVDTAVRAANEIIERDDLLEDYLGLITEDYKGPWSGLSGALNTPATSDHDGVMWRLENNLPDVAASEPSDENEDWTRESARFASQEDLVAVGVLASAAAAAAAGAMQPGAGGWLGGAINIAAANISTAALGTIYYFSGTHLDAVAQGLPDIDASDATPVHWNVFTFGTASFRSQIAMQILDVDGERGQTLRRVFETTWHDWAAMGGGAGYLDPMATRVDLGEVAVSASQTINIDLSLAEVFFFSLETANTTGSLTITVTNAPVGGNWNRHFYVRRPGRKPINFPAPWKYNQLQTPQLSSTSGDYALFNIQRCDFFNSDAATITLLTQQARP